MPPLPGSADAPLTPAVLAQLQAFRRRSGFASRGGIVTDLDGTAVLERDGRVWVAESVLEGLRALAEQGRPVVLNTLRFPLNVVRSFGQAWSAVTDAPLPLVSLNGAVLGLLEPTPDGGARFEAAEAFPIPAGQIETVIEGLRRLIGDGVDDLVLFHYGRDWRRGETVWTPRPERIEALKASCLTASAVVSSGLDALHDRLLAEEACMLLLIVDVPEDRRMAYQHINPSRFITAPGVDKLFGARRAAERFGFDLAQSVGAGDTAMDSFLAGVGLALHVGPMTLEHRGLSDTVRLRDPMMLGTALLALAEPI